MFILNAGMDPVQALLAHEELDDEWKNRWEEWVVWEERGKKGKAPLFSFFHFYINLF